MASSPPILCKHPLLDTIEALAGNPTVLQKMIDDIEAGGAAASRLAKIEGDGLLGRYTEVQKTHAHAQLLGSWGGESALVHISNSLATALVKVRDSKRPLRAWWLVGATDQGVRCAVTEDSSAVYFLLLTPPLEEDALAAKASFDVTFLNALKQQAGALRAWTDSF